jgi:hypothetical protein
MRLKSGFFHFCFATTWSVVVANECPLDPLPPTPTDLPANNPFDFAKYAHNTDFCKQNTFRKGNTWICGGGGTSGSGSGCDPKACSSGQYSFNATNIWHIKTSAATATKHRVYRAFAYTPLITSELISKRHLVVRFSFMLGYESWKMNRAILLFYGDSEKKTTLQVKNGTIELFDTPKVKLLSCNWYSLTLDMTIGGNVSGPQRDGREHFYY